MPFTPYHFGPGLLVKAVLPRHFSFVAFAATQVVIDCETLFHLLRHEYPLHRILHTHLGATAIGVVTGLVVGAAAGFIHGHRAAVRPAPKTVAIDDAARQRAKRALLAGLGGGIIGGISHVLLDSMMHQDIRPGWPFSQSNAMLGAVPLETLHGGCVAAGVVAIVLLAIREFARGVLPASRDGQG